MVVSHLESYENKQCYILGTQLPYFLQFHLFQVLPPTNLSLSHPSTLIKRQSLLYWKGCFSHRFKNQNFQSHCQVCHCVSFSHVFAVFSTTQEHVGLYTAIPYSSIKTNTELVLMTVAVIHWALSFLLNMIMASNLIFAFHGEWRQSYRKWIAVFMPWSYIAISIV